jgi:hypothetical protein
MATTFDMTSTAGTPRSTRDQTWVSTEGNETVSPYYNDGRLVPDPSVAYVPALFVPV